MQASESRTKTCKNWNMFAGEKNYKCNFALEFVAPFTLERYKHDKFERLRFHVKSYLILSFLVWLSFYALCKPVRFISFAGVTGILCFASYMLLPKRSRVPCRFLLVLCEFWFQSELFATCTQLGYYFIFFNIPTFISGISGEDDS